MWLLGIYCRTGRNMWISTKKLVMVCYFGYNTKAKWSPNNIKNIRLEILTSLMRITCVIMLTRIWRGPWTWSLHFNLKTAGWYNKRGVRLAARYCIAKALRKIKNLNTILKALIYYYMSLNLQMKLKIKTRVH